MFFASLATHPRFSQQQSAPMLHFARGFLVALALLCHHIIFPLLYVLRSLCRTHRSTAGSSSSRSHNKHAVSGASCCGDEKTICQGNITIEGRQKGESKRSGWRTSPKRNPKRPARRPARQINISAYHMERSTLAKGGQDSHANMVLVGTALKQLFWVRSSRHLYNCQ